jgi:hypothetical protein
MVDLYLYGSQKGLNTNFFCTGTFFKAPRVRCFNTKSLKIQKGIHLGFVFGSIIATPPAYLIRYINANQYLNTICWSNSAM